MGEFYVNQKAVVLVRCLGSFQCLEIVSANSTIPQLRIGVHTIYIDDYILAADIYRRDWFW